MYFKVLNMVLSYNKNTMNIYGGVFRSSQNNARKITFTFLTYNLVIM